MMTGDHHIAFPDRLGHSGLGIRCRIGSRNVSAAEPVERAVTDENTAAVGVLIGCGWERLRRVTCSRPYSS